MKYRVIFLLCVLLFASCGIWKDPAPDVSAAEEQPEPVRTGPVVYVYTSPEFSRSSLLEPLLDKYAPSGADDLVRLFTSVTELDDPAHGAIVLTIGADYGIIRPLSRLADNRKDLRILTLFSLADPVLLEYFSELVLDIDLDAELLTPESETRGIPVTDEDLSLLIVALVRYADERDWNLTRSQQLLSRLDMVFSDAGREGIPPGWDIRPYVDPDSGIRSRNHLKLHLPEEN